MRHWLKSIDPGRLDNAAFGSKIQSMSNHKTLDIFTRLLDFPSPPGGEYLIGDEIEVMISAFDYSHERDGAGNITVDIEGRDSSKGRMILAAHMDEIAMVVKKIEDNGDLRATRSGGLYPAKLGEGPVDILGSNGPVKGILSFGSMHRRDAENFDYSWDNVRIITGHSPVQLADLGVGIGSAAVPSREIRGPITMGQGSDPLVASWTFDDRIGVATLIRLLDVMNRESIIPERPTTVAFTVHEEGGCHGAKNVARRLSPEVFIAIDGCPMPPGIDLAMDGRPGVWCKDSNTQFDRNLIEDLSSAAVAAGTELQRAVYDSAASDASAVYAAGFADRVATVGHVRENSHGYEVARLSVFDNLLSVVREFVTGWKG